MSVSLNSVYNERGDKCYGRTIYFNLCASRFSVWVKAKGQKRSHLRNRYHYTKEHDHSSFYQFLQMEHSHKNTDCYFFCYSTCKKGDNCPFRHEPSALGCETMCMYWQQGKCLDEHCNYRHMELKKNRKKIACYWETQPGGCRKPHCSFLHQRDHGIISDPINPVKNSELTSKSLAPEWLNRPDDTKYDGSSTESDQGRGSSEAGSFIGSPAVDPLIVKFEEESDNESIPSPVKPQPRVPYCKTYEEIRLEEIQAESAAYYSYETDDYQSDVGGGKIKIRRTRKICLYPQVGKEKKGEGTKGEGTKGLDFEVLSLEEIRRRKRRKAVQERDTKTTEKQTTVPDKEESMTDFLKDAIKTLAELRETTTTTTTTATSVRGVKRTIEECDDDPASDSHKPKRNEPFTTSVPPVKLRRSPKRFVSAGGEVSDRRRNAAELASKRREDDVQGKTNDRKIPANSTDRVSGSDPTESSNVARRNEVEIRLCDSSTDEDQVQVEKTEEKKSVGTYVAEDSKVTTQLSCDSMLNVNEDEYLMLDMASDDILKDIDALLKEKSSV